MIPLLLLLLLLLLFSEVLQPQETANVPQRARRNLIDRNQNANLSQDNREAFRRPENICGTAENRGLNRILAGKWYKRRLV